MKRRLTDEDLTIPPSDDFGKVSDLLARNLPAMSRLAVEKPGNEPEGFINGAAWRLFQRRHLKHISAAIGAGHNLMSEIGKTLEQRLNDPDSRSSSFDRLRQQLREARPVLRRGMQAVESYHHVLLDDRRTPNLHGDETAKLMAAIGEVTDDKFNFAAVFDWLDEGKRPGPSRPADGQAQKAAPAAPAPAPGR